MNYPCSRGHQSTEADYCSECGTRIQSGLASPVSSSPERAAPAAVVLGASGELCPDCATTRPSGARFCEVCRYDFQSHASFSPNAAPDVKPVSAPAPSVPEPVAEPIANTPALVAPPKVRESKNLSVRLQLRILADPSLQTEADADVPCPVGRPERIFHLDLEENLVGRQYEGKGAHPELVVHDPGISRLHLKFLRTADGSFTVLELGSANGTTFNGTVLEPGVITAIQPGDTLLLGMWTRLSVEAR